MFWKVSDMSPLKLKSSMGHVHAVSTSVMRLWKRSRCPGHFRNFGLRRDRGMVRSLFLCS